MYRALSLIIIGNEPHVLLFDRPTTAHKSQMENAWDDVGTGPFDYAINVNSFAGL